MNTIISHMKNGYAFPFKLNPFIFGIIRLFMFYFDNNI